MTKSEKAFAAVEAVVARRLKLVDAELRDLLQFLEVEGASNAFYNIDWLLGHVESLRETYPVQDG